MTGAVVYQQGLAAVSAPNLNAFAQTTTLATDLINTPGISGMNVWVTGTSATNDGGQGWYNWQPNAGPTTSLPGVISPNGSTGAWVLVPTPIGPLTGTNATTASSGTQTLPSAPAGFISTTFNGVAVKIPYYNP